MSKNTNDKPQMQVFKSIKNIQSRENLIKRFSKKGFCADNQWLKNLALAFTYLADLVKVATALYGAYLVFSFLIPYSIISGFLSITVLVFLVYAQRKSSDQLWDLFCRDGKIYIGWAAFSTFLFALSVLISVYGTYEGVEDFAAPPALIVQDSTLLALQAEKNKIDNSIKKSEATTWKGKITTRSQDAIKVYSKTQLAITNAILQRTNAINSENEQIKQSNELDVNQMIFITIFILLLIEILYEVSLYFCSYFDFRKLCETAHPTDLQLIFSRPVGAPAPQINLPAAIKKSPGFDYPGKDIHSGSSFTFEDRPLQFEFDTNINSVVTSSTATQQHIDPQVIVNATDRLKILISNLQAEKNNLKTGHGKATTVWGRIENKFLEVDQLDFNLIPADLKQKLDTLKGEIYGLKHTQ